MRNFINGRWLWPALFACALLVPLLYNPVGYVGGWSDDWQYLEAARCLVASNDCLPVDHWQARWPVTVPLAASIALFGESRLSVGVPFFAYFLGVASLIVLLGNRYLGAPIGWLSASLFVAAPVVASLSLQPGIEMAELFFLLVAAAALARNGERRSVGALLFAGLCFGLAFQVRETAILAAAPFAWLLLRARASLTDLALFSAAALTPFAIELVAYGAATGDPLYRRHLSLAHTDIMTTETIRPIAPGARPFFNPDVIGAWRHSPGLAVHWSIDGIINLFSNGAAGATLRVAALLAIPLFWLTRPPARSIGIVALIGVFWMAMLIYGFAIDPKPRMMMIPILASCVLMALFARAFLDAGYAMLAAASVSTCMTYGLLLAIAQPSFWHVEDAIAKAVVDAPGKANADEHTRRHFAMIPELAALPDGTEGERMLRIAEDQCDAVAPRGWRVTLSFALSRFNEWIEPPRYACIFGK